MVTATLASSPPSPPMVATQSHNISMSPRLTAGALITVLSRIGGWEPGCPRTKEAVTCGGHGQCGTQNEQRGVLVLAPGWCWCWLAGQLLRTPAFPGLPPATSPAPGQGGEDSGHTSTDTDDGNSHKYHFAWMDAWIEHSLHRYYPYFIAASLGSYHSPSTRP